MIHANSGHGTDRQYHHQRRGSLAIGCHHRGPQSSAETCPAGANRSSSGEHLPVIEVARQVGSSRPAVWRWQQRFAEEGVDGLLRDKTREPGKAPLPLETVAKVLTLPCSRSAPGSTTHWTGRMVAKSVGVSLSAVQRLWNEHSLQPHRLRTFKRSKDPPFAKKVEDMVGLYMEPRPATRCCPSTRRAGYRHATARSRPNLERTGALEAYPRLICSEERPIGRRGLAEDSTFDGRRR